MGRHSLVGTEFGSGRWKRPGAAPRGQLHGEQSTPLNCTPKNSSDANFLCVFSHNRKALYYTILYLVILI